MYFILISLSLIFLANAQNSSGLDKIRIDCVDKYLFLNSDLVAYCQKYQKTDPSEIEICKVVQIDGKVVEKCYSFSLKSMVTFVPTIPTTISQRPYYDYLTSAGIQYNNKDKDEWIELCTLNIRVEGGTCCNLRRVSGSCSSSKKNVEILELKVQIDSENRCTYNSFIENSPVNEALVQTVSNKYDIALRLAQRDDNKVAFSQIEAERENHIFRARTKLNSATLSGTAVQSSAVFGAGGWCNLRLFGRVKALDY